MWIDCFKQTCITKVNIYWFILFYFIKMYGSLAIYRTMSSGDRLYQLRSLVGKLNALEQNIWMYVITFRLIIFSYLIKGRKQLSFPGKVLG